MASYLTGSMNTLPDKLDKLKNRPMNIEQLLPSLEGLKKEFDGIAVGQKTDEAKVWMKQVRELFFTIEDWIDERPEKNTAGNPLEAEEKSKETSMVALSKIEEIIKETNRADPSKIEKKIKGTNLMDPLEIERKLKETNMASSSEIQEETDETKTVDPEKKIKEFMDLIREALRRLESFVPVRDDGDGFRTSKIIIDSRLPLEDRTCLVGLERPTKKLKELLTDGQTRLKVVSIVGTAGLGKTTLARKIHEELQGKFQCGAFVHIGSRHTSLLKTLVNLLQQITSSKLYGSWGDLDEQQVIAKLWAFLIEKRYFIVVDGIWNIRTWRVISCALPGNNLGSRILITTREKDVAKSCSPRYTDVVHQMEVLSDDDSKRLFEQEADVLKICGGIPLAITVAAGLSTGDYTRLEEQKTVGQRILSSFEQYYSMSPAMVKVLHMSFSDLSLPARSCLMYLSVFREYETIMKDRLIRLWAAEGFIPSIEEEILWVTGERYFNELISRRLIQPVFNFEDDQAVGCTVHTVILDFIRSISKEENFATRATELNSGPFPCDTIRRYSLDCRNKDEDAPLSTSIAHLSSLRSLTVFGDVEEMHATKAPEVSLNILSYFKLLRVLDLEDTKNLEYRHLEGIGRLVLLRFLGLGGTGIHRLPKEIGELEQLETLDLRRNGLIAFSSSPVKLQQVTHLLLRVLCTDIWEMQELEEASDILVLDSTTLGNVAELLRKSEKLRMLGVTFKTSPRENDFMSFFNEVVKSKLQSLSLNWHHRGYLHIALLVDSWEKATALAGKKFEPQRFELRISDRELVDRVPPNLGSLASLTHLHIEISKANTEDFLVLEGLTNLVLLHFLANYFYVKGDDFYVKGRFIIKGGIFPCLKVFSFKVDNDHLMMGLEFEEGAMPQLRRLVRSFKASERGDKECLDIGSEHLTCLARIHATINCQDATVSQVEATEAAVRGEISKIATKPTLELSRENERQMREDEGRHSLYPLQRRRF